MKHRFVIKQLEDNVKAKKRYIKQLETQLHVTQFIKDEKIKEVSSLQKSIQILKKVS